MGRVERRVEGGYGRGEKGREGLRQCCLGGLWFVVCGLPS
jgi:hypothetical protein